MSIAEGKCRAAVPRLLPDRCPHLFYPLGFGDIRRAFADHLNSGAQPDQQQLPVPVNNGQAMAGSESPAAVALATRCLPQGLLVTVSLHDLSAGGGSSASAGLRKVEQILNHLRDCPSQIDRGHHASRIRRCRRICSPFANAAGRRGTASESSVPLVSACRSLSTARWQGRSRPPLRSTASRIAM